MRRIAAAIAFLGGIGAFLLARPAEAQMSVSVNLTIGSFYDELSPYGEWVDCRYGACWVPRGIDRGWQPYSNGEWIYTRYGWTWVSQDPWGGDPFHYGTWDFVDHWGWVWVPGTVWAPAWVTWSYSNSYVGWAPMPPTVTFGRSGYSGGPVVVSETRYVFVPTNRFVGTSVSSVRVEPRRNAEIYRQAKHVTRFDVSNDVVRNSAIPMATVQKAMGHKIETREIDAARTAPRTMSSSGFSGGKHVTIVAPASDVKAAHASRKKGATHAGPSEPQHPQQEAKPQEKPKHYAKAPQQEARPPQQEKPKHYAKSPQQEARPPQQVPPKHEAKPSQPEARPQQQEQPKPQAKPAQPQARPPQQEKPKHDARPPEAKPPHQTQPAGKDHGNNGNKDKKDPPGGGGKPD